MRGFVPPDPEGGVSEVRFAVVHAPRAKRHRFSANCVNVVSSKEEAIALSDEANNDHPAKVLGPSKSSEGQFIFYLVEWLSPES
ncbi:MAG: hypothetical protein AAF372_03430 [Pseudomonadota bacterium]